MKSHVVEESVPLVNLIFSVELRAKGAVKCHIILRTDVHQNVAKFSVKMGKDI
jgi:hypothetical protein